MYIKSILFSFFKHLIITFPLITKPVNFTLLMFKNFIYLFLFVELNKSNSSSDLLSIISTFTSNKDKPFKFNFKLDFLLIEEILEEKSEKENRYKKKTNNYINDCCVRSLILGCLILFLLLKISHLLGKYSDFVFYDIVRSVFLGLDSSFQIFNSLKFL